MSREFVKAVGELWRTMFDAYRPELHYMRGPGPKWHAKHWVTTTDAILRGPPTVLDLWGSRPSQQALCINCCGLRSGFGRKRKDEFCCFQNANSHRGRYKGPVWDKEAGAAERCEPNLGFVLSGEVGDQKMFGIISGNR